MNRRRLSPFELHVEKVVVCAAAVFAGVVLCVSWIRSPNAVAYGGARVRPAELDRAILENARDLEGRVRGVVFEPAPVERFAERLQRRHREGLFGSDNGAGLLRGTLRVAAPFGTSLDAYDLGSALAPAERIALAVPLPPSKPVAATGLGMYADAGGDGGSRAPQIDAARVGDAVEVVWVTVAAYVDLAALRNEMTNAHYPPFRATPYIAGVEVQRQELGPNASSSAWKAVAIGGAGLAAIPEPLFDDESGLLLNRGEIDRGFATVRENQQAIMQPAFHTHFVAGERWRVPPLDGIRQEREAAGAAARADLSIGRGLFRAVDFARARELARLIFEDPDAASDTRLAARKLMRRIERQIKGDGPTGPEPPEPSPGGYDIQGNGRVPLAAQLSDAQSALQRRRARAAELFVRRFVDHKATGRPAVWVHDESVEPGKTYRYRMRVNLWNRYVGRPRALRNPAAARAVLLRGEWSLPSDPVRTAAKSHFFLRGRHPGRDAASIEVWKWHAGLWHKATFVAGLGDELGGVRAVPVRTRAGDGAPVRKEINFSTGAVVLDLRFDETVPQRFATGPDGEFRHRIQTTLVMTYLDPTDGRVKQRNARADRYDPRRKRLRLP